MPLTPHDLITRFGSPLYVYDLALIRARAQALKSAIQRITRHVLGVEKYRPVVGRIETANHSQKRGLPTSGRSQKGKKLARFDIYAHLIYSKKIAEAAADLAYF